MDIRSRHDASRPALARALRALAAGLAWAVVLPADAATEGAQALADYGCINCHGARSGFAPSLKSLSEHVRRKGQTPQALQELLHEMREQRSVHTHQMVSDEMALEALRAMGEAGAK